MMRTLLMVCALAAIAAPLHAKRASLIVLPLANLSGADEAPAAVHALFEARLERRGWDVVPLDEVEKVLEAERMRHLDSVSSTTRAALLQRFDAGAIVTGSVLAWRDGASPAVAITARLTDREGRVVWGNVAALSADELEGILGFGRPARAHELARQSVDAVLQRFPKPGRRSHVVRGPEGIGRPVTFRSARHPRGQVHRVCIMPFATSNADAARVLMEILTVRLEASREFEVVEAAEFRTAMRAAGLTSIATLTSAELTRVGEALGTPLFLRGNLYEFHEAGPRSEVHFDLNLADVSTGAVLWAVTHQARGSDYSRLLQRGTVQNAIALVDRVVSESIAAQREARPRQFVRKVGP